MLSIADIARRKGVSKQAISKRVARLEQLGQIATQKGPRGTVLVSLAEYDRAVGETSELAHVQAPQPKIAAAVDAEHVYTREQAREKAYAADLKKLDLDERLGKLVPIEDLAAAGGRIAETLVRQIDQMSGRAGELAAAVAKDGETGARSFLRTMGRDLREVLARELAALADVARRDRTTPAPDEPES